MITMSESTKSGPVNGYFDRRFEKLAEEFVPLGLTNTELDDLEAFLTTALRDPDLARYAPESLPSGNCFPNADAVSRVDLGCD